MCNCDECTDGVLPDEVEEDYFTPGKAELDSNPLNDYDPYGNGYSLGDPKGWS